MRFLIEFDGPLADISALHFRTYHECAGAIGWSRIDQATYWRLIRTKGKQADVLPGAKPVKLAEYQTLFDERFESPASIAQLAVRADALAAIRRLQRYGSCHIVTLGTNLESRRAQLVQASATNLFAGVHGLPVDPRLRPRELKSVAEGDKRTIVIAGNDALLRSAREAELFGVGVSCGSCTPARLHQAGADIVYAGLSELADSLETGGADLVKAGLLPAPLQ